MSEDIIQQYNAVDIEVPEEFIPWMRSNHAGETGAVWIYKGASCAFWSKSIRKMANEHQRTEEHHLLVMNYLVPAKQRSKLLFLWRTMGFFLGFLPSIFGFKSFSITIQAVETFVEKHYQAQIDMLKQSEQNASLLFVLERCCQDEVLHKQDAASRLPAASFTIIAKCWWKIVAIGSEVAVSIAKKI